MSHRRLSFVLLGILLPLAAFKASASPQAAPVAALPSLTALAGEYTDPQEPDTPYDIYVQNGQLLVESERLVPQELKPKAELEFTLEGTPLTFRFTLKDAQATLLTLLRGDGKTEYLRTGEPLHHVFHDYQSTEVMIPMRDGVKLHTILLRPADIATPLPFLIERTPYGVDGLDRKAVSYMMPELARAGYIFVAQDIRGRYKSKGKFLMMRPLADHADPKNTDESTDASDTVAWLLKNVPHNNGRAGFMGTSYPGFLAMMAGIDPHPAVRAVSPQAPMIDVWLGDDFFHNGAFRQTYGYDYVTEMESSKKFSEVDYGKDAEGHPRDGYDFFLERGSLRGDVQHAHKKNLPTWKLFFDHPAYDAVWASRGVARDLTRVAVPTLSVGGFYDQEDLYGPQTEYAALEAHDEKKENFMVLGPWRHGSWSQTTRHLGNLQYGEPIGKEYRRQIEAKFFAYYLKDEPGFDLEDTATFQTGSNQWKRYAHFPPAEARSTPLYLLGAGKLGWNSAAGHAETTYTSDPANPIPYRHRPIQPTYGPGSKWGPWMTEDQRFVADRRDVAVFRLPTLTHDLTVTGEVVADLFAATTGTDGDFVVKLIDVYPADDAEETMRGYQMIINAEIFRGRYLHGFNNPQPLQSGAVNEFKFSLHDVDHVFRAGHAVMVQVQSSWFPLYDRNPQKFVANIMKAVPADFQPAAITIESGPGQASSVLLPVVGRN